MFAAEIALNLSRKGLRDVNRILLRLAVCLTTLLGLASSARADLITGSVQWDPGASTSKVYANGAVDPPSGAPGIAFKNWSSWTFSNAPLPVTGSVIRHSLVGDLETFGLEKGEPAHFSDGGKGTPFSLTFDIHDGSVPGEITFTGLLFGTLTKDGSGNETSSLDIEWLGPTTKSLDLDHHVYSLSISGWTRTGTFPDGYAVGGVTVDVKVTHNPEPAGLVLAVLALPAFGLSWLWKKRKARLPMGG